MIKGRSRLCPFMLKDFESHIYCSIKEAPSGGMGDLAAKITSRDLCGGLATNACIASSIVNALS